LNVDDVGGCGGMKCRWLVLLAIMLCGLYPIAELTRIILVAWEWYYPAMGGEFLRELIIMWGMYIGIIPFYIYVTRWWRLKIK